MKKIVFITNSIGFGGAEKMLTFVANNLAKRGNRCVIINLNTVGEYINLHKQNIFNKVILHTIELPKKCKNLRMFHIKEIRKIVKDERADVIVGFTGYPNFYARIVGLMLGVPSIMSERGDPERTHSNSIKCKIMEYIINTSNGGVFQTEGAKDFYGKGLQKKGVVIPNPIFIKGEVPFIEQSSRMKTIVSVGRFDIQQKRNDIMIKAFKIFLARHPSYKLKLYGSGPDEEKIRKIIKELDIEDKVLFMGVTKNPMHDISRDGMFLITSDYEGIPNALLEAMAVGLPCVATDCTPGGARLLINNEENGLLVPIGDEKKVANAMCTFAANAELAEKCGKNARDITNRFEPQKIIDMWDKYISLISKE